MMLRYFMDLIWTRVKANSFFTCFVTNQKACAELVSHAVKAHAP